MLAGSFATEPIHSTKDDEQTEIDFSLQNKKKNTNEKKEEKEAI